MGAVLVPALLAVSGCGSSAVVTVAGYAADAVSYAATGKGLLDQAVSQVAAEDCVMYRALNGQPVCRDEHPDRHAPAVAVARAAPDAPAVAPRPDAATPDEENASMPAPGPVTQPPETDLMIFAAAGSEEVIRQPDLR